MDTWAKEQVNPVGLTQVVTPANNSGLQGVGTSSDPLQFCANNLPTTPSTTGDKIVVSSTARPCGELRDQASIKAFTVNADTGTSNINLGDNLAIIGDTDTKVKTAITAPNTLKVSLDTTGATLGQVPTVNATGGITYSDPAPAFTSPLTTKGDIYVNDGTTDTRMPVGTDGQVLIASSGSANGLKYTNFPTQFATGADNGTSVGVDGNVELGGVLHKDTTIDIAGNALNILNLPTSSASTVETLGIDTSTGQVVRRVNQLPSALSIPSSASGVVSVTASGATFAGITPKHINTTYTNTGTYDEYVELSYSCRAHLFTNTQANFNGANFQALQIVIQDDCTLADINGATSNFSSFTLPFTDSMTNNITNVNQSITHTRKVRVNAGQAITFTSSVFLSANQVGATITDLQINTGFDNRATLTITPIK